MEIISVLIIAVIPRPKNIPARVTMNGWISRYATRKPCTTPKATPISSATKTATYVFTPLFSIRSARTIQTRAVTEPTEISIPPVIITMVSPHAITRSPALDTNRFRNICGFAKPLSAKMIIPAIYITANKAIVIRSRKPFPVIFFFCIPFAFITSDLLLLPHSF